MIRKALKRSQSHALVGLRFNDGRRFECYLQIPENMATGRIELVNGPTTSQVFKIWEVEDGPTGETHYE